MKIRLPNTALFVRSLAVDNRHWQGYVFRLIMLAVIILCLVQITAISTVSAMFSAVGLYFFQSIAHINLVFIALFGISLFSTAITEEKEIDSLGLLLMTGIGSFSMLISKSSSKVLVAMMLIIAQIPFTLLAITLGGIGMHQILCAYITILCYTFAVANIALFSSVIAPRSSLAAAFTFVMLSILSILTLFWDNTQFLSPFIRINEIMKTGFSTSAFTANEIINLIIGGLFFIISLIIFNYFSRTSTGSLLLKISKTNKISKNRKSKWKIFQAGRAWRKAIIWKDFYFNAGGFAGYGAFIFMTIMLLCLFIWLFHNGRDRLPRLKDIGEMMTLIGFVILLIQGIFLSSSLFSKEVWEKTHSSLMLLPMTVRQMAYRKIAGGLLMTVPMLLIILIGFIMRGKNPFPGTLSAFSVFSANIMYYFTLAICYYHLVVYFSIYARYGAFAIAGGVLLFIQLVLLLPMTLLPFLSMRGSSFLGFNYELMQMIRDVISMMIYLFLIFILHRKIGKRLTVLAGS